MAGLTGILPPPILRHVAATSQDDFHLFGNVVYVPCGFVDVLSFLRTSRLEQIEERTEKIIGWCLFDREPLESFDFSNATRCPPKFFFSARGVDSLSRRKCGNTGTMGNPRT